MPEFELIDRYFKSRARSRPDVLLGIGDDCAVLQPPAGMQLAVTMDTLVAGVHFPLNTSAQDIGYKSLAVNLSDLAAMGAQPAWAMLALTLPDENETWVDAFMQGFDELARQYQVQLMGGDTTRGPLSITIQVTGFVEPERVLRRDAAKMGDRIYISGTLGDAALGLKKCLQKIPPQFSLPYCVQRLNRPIPRLELGRALLDVSHCAIDVSDGLLADLGHIIKASHCAARIELVRVPLSDDLKKYYGSNPDWPAIIAGGDDYELCFTVAPENEKCVQAISRELNLALTCVGDVVAGEGIHCVDQHNKEIVFTQCGYNHFANPAS